MKVLLSAIACRPDLGSEAKVGWDAAMAISEHHECHVVTHTSNRKAIELKQAEGIATQIKFHYFGKDFTWHPSRLVARLQSWLIFRKWQAQLLPFAEELHTRHTFDLTHHVTYVTWRVASPLWHLPVPFIWGPVGGTASIPPAFFSILSPAARIFEIARQISGTWARHSRAFLACATNSATVVVANQETEAFFRKFRPKAPMEQLWPVFFTPEQIAALRDQPRRIQSPGGPLRLFAGGNLEGRKGVALALEAMAEARRRGLQARFTFGGWGPELSTLQTLASRLGLADCVEFHQGFAHEAYMNCLKDSDIYFLPSFRETTPITLIEAALAGCYPVVADSSGAGEIVRRIGGMAVAAHNRRQIVSDLADALEWCDRNRSTISSEAQKASSKAVDEFGKARYIRRINEIYQDATDRMA